MFYLNVLILIKGFFFFFNCIYLSTYLDQGCAFSVWFGLKLNVKPNQYGSVWLYFNPNQTNVIFQIDPNQTKKGRVGLDRFIALDLNSIFFFFWYYIIKNI